MLDPRSILALVLAALAGAGAALRPQPAAKDPQPPDGAFAQGTGPTEAIREMAWLEGRWDVVMRYDSPDGRSFEFRNESVIEPILAGGFLQERVAAPAGPGRTNTLLLVRSYDRFRSTYRVVVFDEVVTLADVFEGPGVEGGLAVDNVAHRTAGIFFGKPAHLRITQTRGEATDSFTLLWESSPDDGRTWTRAAVYQYTRK